MQVCNVSFTLVVQPRPFLPSKDPLPIIVRDAYGINSPVFAYFVRGGVSCTRQMVKVRFDGAPQKRDVIEMK